MDLQGASAIVTGGASGLGEASLRRLVARGAHVTIADLNQERADAIVAELGDRVSFVRCDVTSEDDVVAMTDHAASRGALRVVVSCAGFGVAGRVVGRDGSPHPLEGFAWTVNLCLIGTFNAMRIGAAAMAKTEPLDEDGQRGVVVNTASIAAYEGQIGQVAYSAAKGGVVAMTLPAARDLATIGVRVVAIAPGTFMTPAMAQATPEMIEAFSKISPFPKRLGHADEFAKLVEQICDNTMLNGEVIRLDGGVRFPPR